MKLKNFALCATLAAMPFACRFNSAANEQDARINKYENSLKLSGYSDQKLFSTCSTAATRETKKMPPLAKYFDIRPSQACADTLEKLDADESYKKIHAADSAAEAKKWAVDSARISHLLENVKAPQDAKAYAAIAKSLRK